MKASGRAMIAEVERLAASGLPDEQFLERTVQLLHDRQPAWNWVGIYLLVGETLVLGPYVGKPTEHTRIPVGVGVCGSAVAANENRVVDDVRAEANYLACSVETRAEIVVLIRADGRIVGQFDVDSDEVGAFRVEDEALLEALVPLVAPRCAAIVRGWEDEQGSAERRSAQ